MFGFCWFVEHLFDFLVFFVILVFQQVVLVQRIQINSGSTNCQTGICASKLLPAIRPVDDPRRLAGHLSHTFGFRRRSRRKRPIACLHTSCGWENRVVVVIWRIENGDQRIQTWRSKQPDSHALTRNRAARNADKSTANRCSNLPVSRAWEKRPVSNAEKQTLARVGEAQRRSLRCVAILIRHRTAQSKR